MKRVTLLAAALVAAAVFFGGCREEIITAPDGAVIELSASPANIPAAGGETTITVRVTEDGAPVRDGTEVYLSTTKGVLSATTVTTDVRGVATAKLKASSGETTGNATVEATSGKAPKATLTVAFTNEDSMILTISAGSAEVRADEGHDTTITARLTKPSGSVPTSQVIAFRLEATGGGVSFPGRLSPMTATSDPETGLATATLAATGAAGTVLVRAQTIGADDATTQVSFYDAVSDMPSLTVDKSTITMGTSPRDQDVTVVATLVTLLGAAPPGHSVGFSTAPAGTFEPTYTSKTATVVTDSSGRATVKVRLTATEQQLLLASGDPTVTVTASETSRIGTVTKSVTITVQ